MDRFEQVRTFISSLVKEIKQAPEPLYCLLLGVYHLSFLTENVRFNVSLVSSGFVVQMLSAAVLILLGISISSILIMLVRNKWALIPVFILVLGFLYLCARMQKDLFDGLMIVLLAVGAYGKDFTKILKVLVWCTIGMTVLTMVGVPIGLTAESSKVGTYGTGLSFGFIHPNCFGSFVFFIFVTIWYLYVRNRSRLLEYGYFVLSLLLAAFMTVVPKCRTQALLLFLFPLMVLLCRWCIGSEKTVGRPLSRKIPLWFLTVVPVLCFLVTVILATQSEWLVTKTFGTYFENSSKRFIQAGMAFREHGFPLFGETIRFQTGASEIFGGQNVTLYVLDNGYVTYMILRGMIWMAAALLWLSFGNRKMIRRYDGGLLAVSILFCLMGLMERIVFTTYNFVFLYPLADVLGKNITGRPVCSADATKDSTKGQT